MTKQAYQLILKTGVYLSLVPAFFVFKNLLFPFITSKQIAFNILIEILLVFWAAYIVKFKEERPERNYITWGLLAYFFVMVLTCFTGVDFNLSFWGDIERMLGAFHVLHFFGLYIIIITVLKTWKDWKMFFQLSLIAAMFISLYGLSKDGSTIGNIAYIGGQIVMTFYLAILLFVKEKPGIMRWLYAAPLAILLMEFNNINISGAFVGLGFSLLVMAFLYGVLAKNKKIKIATISLFLFGTIFSSWFFVLDRDNFLTRNSDYFRKLSTEINLDKGTFQTRLISWRAALKDYKNQPFLGTGHGNYAVTFDKHFDPNFFNYTRVETYFDRAHNNILDILITTGTIGLLAYLSIFAAIAFYLIKGCRKGNIGIHDFTLVSALITGYFVQNLAVFDSYVTYILLMTVLGYVYWLSREKDENQTSVSAEIDISDYAIMGGIVMLMLIALGQDSIRYFAQNPTRLMVFNLLVLLGFIGSVMYYNYKKWAGRAEQEKEADNKSLVVISLALLLSLIMIWQYNIKPLKMLIATIEGQRYLAAKNLDKTYEAYKKALSYRTVLDRDSRTSMIRVFADTGNLSKLKNYSPEEVIRFTIEHAEKNVAYNPGDSMNQMTLAQVYNAAASLKPVDSPEFEEYWNKAMLAIDAAIAASPGRIPVYFQKAQFYITRGQKDQAIEVLESVLPYNDDYPDTYCHLSSTYLHYGQPEKAYEYLDGCIDRGGAGILTPTFQKRYIEHYKSVGDQERLLALYEALSRKESGNPQHFVELAKLYAAAGQPDKAVKSAEKAKELDPEIAKYVDEFIAGLKQ